MYLKKSMIHLKMDHCGTTISHKKLLVPPWIEYAILIDKDVENVRIENCYIERLSWWDWIKSLIHFTSNREAKPGCKT